MSISFRRPKKPVRPRLVMIGNDGDDEEMDDEPIITSTPVIVPPTISDSGSSSTVGNGSQSSLGKNKSDKQVSSESSKKPATLLSFDEELEGDDGEVFKVKKSSTSRRLMKQRDREKKESRVSVKASKDNSVPGNSEVELQKAKLQVETFTTDIKITNSKKGNTSPVLRILNGREAEAVHMESSDEEEEEDENLRFRRPTAASAIQEELRRVLEQGQIPDAKLIHEARKRKQMARQQGGTEFIPVDNVSRYALYFNFLLIIIALELLKIDFKRAYFYQ